MYSKVYALGKKHKILHHPKQVSYRAQLCFQGPLGFAVPPPVGLSNLGTLSNDYGSVHYGDRKLLFPPRVNTSLVNLFLFGRLGKTNGSDSVFANKYGGLFI